MKIVNSIQFIFLLLIFLLTINRLYGDEKWVAKRITPQENQNESNCWSNYIKIFELKSLPNQAMALIACDSKYWMWVNGKLVVFEGQLKRGPTPIDTYYDEVDISKYLKIGANKIAILVWYFGKDGFSHKNSGQTGLVFQCNSLNLKTDETWLSQLNTAFEYSSRPWPNYRLSESNIRYDARLNSFDWTKENSNIKFFKRAKIVGDAESHPWHKLIKRPIPQWKDYGLKKYESSVQFPFVSKGDTIICKLAYNAQITPYFKIESDAGRIVEIRTDQYFGGGEPNIRAEYVTNCGLQEYESFGWMSGQFVRYYFPPGTVVLDLKYRETGYDTDFTGSFYCSDPFFEKLWRKAQRTLYITMRDNYMDCPDRERAQWWGDVTNESGEAFYSLSPSSSLLMKKGMLELVNWQRNDSVLFSPVPGIYKNELPSQMLASIGYYGFWNYYMNTGDKETIIQIYDKVKRYLELWNLNDSGILAKRKVDWNWGDWGTNIDTECLNNAWYYLALKGYCEMSKLLGYYSEYLFVNQRMTDFKKSYNLHFWNGKRYQSKDYSGDIDDRAQALSVVAGLVDAQKYPIIYEILKNKFNASPYMEKYVIEALFLMGYEEFGLKRLKERFYSMVNNSDISTLYEGWGIGKEGYGGGTINHAWSGGGLTILSQYVCGVSPAEAGWKTINIKPQLGSLTFASTSNITISGKYSIEIRKFGQKMDININLSNSNAIVFIPSYYKNILVNGKSVMLYGKLLKGVIEYSGKKNKYYEFRIPNGNWNIVAY